MRNFVVLAAGLALAIAGAPSATAQHTLGVPATAGWKHAETGLILRASLAGLARTELGDNSQSELDVYATFGDIKDVVVTVYLFRPALHSVPIWFDRAETQILQRGTYGDPRPTGAPQAFSRSAGASADSLRRIYVPSKPPYSSTGLAILPMGEWLVALRISATALTPDALQARLDSVIGAIGWPAGVALAPAAVPIAACALPPLAFAKRAKLKKPDMTDALMGAVLASMASEKAEEAQTAETPMSAEPTSWCREGAANKEFSVYRSDERTSRYLLAIADAGRTIDVTPGFPLDGKEPAISLYLHDLDRTLVYPSFNGLPRPEQAWEAIQKNAPVSSSARGGKDLTIQVK
ncbi:hypothetical protein ACG3SL_15940 [Sphingomonas sp. CJ20]